MVIKVRKESRENVMENLMEMSYQSQISVKMEMEYGAKEIHLPCGCGNCCYRLEGCFLRFIFIYLFILLLLYYAIL